MPKTPIQKNKEKKYTREYKPDKTIKKKRYIFSLATSSSMTLTKFLLLGMSHTLETTQGPTTYTVKTTNTFPIDRESDTGRLIRPTKGTRKEGALNTTLTSKS